MLIAVVLTASLTAIPVAAESSAENERYIYTYLTTEMGLNTAAACGIMANIYYETNFTADISASGYYGLFMYWSGLTNELINWCANNGQDRTTVQGQMAFFNWKMENSYQSLLGKLRALTNTAESAYSSADMFCREFERPGNMEYECSKRGSFASGTLFPRYATGSENDTPTLSPEVTLTYTATVTASALNIRTGPGTTYHVTKSIPRGTSVQVVSEVDGWCKLSTGGWVSKTYLTVDEYTSAPAPDPAPDTTPDTPPAETPAPSEPETSGTEYKVTASALYVRSGAGIHTSAVGFLYLNDKVTIVATDVDPATGRTWGQLSTGGWASLYYMTKIGESTSTDTNSGADSGNTSNGTTYTVTASALNVSSGAGTGNAIVGLVWKGNKVTVVATATDSVGKTWGQLTSGGWVSMAYLQ